MSKEIIDIYIEQGYSYNFDLDFTNTSLTNAYFDNCTFNKGMRFRVNTKLDFLNIKNTNVNKLYIGAACPTLFIKGNKNCATFKKRKK